MGAEKTCVFDLTQLVGLLTAVANTGIPTPDPAAECCQHKLSQGSASRTCSHNMNLLLWGREVELFCYADCSVSKYCSCKVGLEDP